MKPGNISINSFTHNKKTEHNFTITIILVVLILNWGLQNAKTIH